MVRVFTNGPGDLGLIPGEVILKTQKMVLDASLLNTQHYKVWIKGKVEQSRERSSTLPYTLVLVAIEKRTFESLSTMVVNFTNFTYSLVKLFQSVGQEENGLRESTCGWTSENERRQNRNEPYFPYEIR